MPKQSPKTSRALLPKTKIEMQNARKIITNNPVLSNQELLEIARRYNIPRHVVTKIAREQGITIKRGRCRGSVLDENTDSRKDPQLRKVITWVGNYLPLIQKKAAPFVRKGVPFERIYNKLLDWIVSHRKKYDPKKGTMSTWVIGALPNIMRQVQRDHFIEAKRFQQREGGDASFWNTQKSRQKTPQEIAISKEKIAHVFNAIKTLSLEEQTVIQERYLKEKKDQPTQEELGMQLGVTKTTIQNIEKRVMAKLRQTLE